MLFYSHKGEIPRKDQRKTEQPDFGKKQRKERVSTDGLEETYAKGRASCVSPLQIEFIAEERKALYRGDSYCRKRPHNPQKERLTKDVR